MPFVFFLLAAGLALSVSGCGSVSDAASDMRERFSERSAPTIKTVSAPQRDVYEAVRITAGQLGYRFVRGGAAQGEYEGVSRVLAGETMGSARQRSMKIKLSRSLDGGTDVAVRVTEIMEADSSNRAGMATESPLRDPVYYEVFFRQLEQVLAPRP